MDLIIVAGMPATGKTTLAKKLAAALGVPMLEKDEIKEEMYKILGYSGLEDRRIDDIVSNARYVERDATHSRHPVHELWDTYPPKPGEVPKTMTRELFKEVFEDLGMSEFRVSGHRIDLDATHPQNLDVDALIAQIKSLLGRE